MEQNSTRDSPGRGGAECYMTGVHRAGRGHPVNRQGKGLLGGKEVSTLFCTQNCILIREAELVDF